MSDIHSVNQVAKKIPALTEPAIRWHLFNRKLNGLSDSGAIIKNGRRVLIDFPKYLEWLRDQGSE